MANLDFSVSVFQRNADREHTWEALHFGGQEISLDGRNTTKLRDRFIHMCREAIRQAAPAQLPDFQLVRGRRLARVRVELTVRCPEGRESFTGKLPLILEPRPIGPDRVMHIAYHPLRQQEWFPYKHEAELESRATAFFQRHWSAAGLLGPQLDRMRTQGRDKLQLIGFRCEPRTLLGSLPRAGEGPEMASIGGRKRGRGTTLLDDLGFDLSRRASDGDLEQGMPRAPYREQLRQLLCGDRKAPVLLIGPSGVGKTTLLHHAITDLLEADGWEAHQNLDRIHHVWQVSGRRIIAGMSYLGQWEQRCVELLEETYAKKVVLLVEDIHAWGRIGESRQNDRNLATFFRGPIARGELSVIGECTAEQFQQLQADASGFANLFTTIHVEPTDSATTLRMLVHEARGLESSHGCAFDPRVYRSVFELSGSLYSGSAYPGKALDLLRSLAARNRVPRERIDALALDEVLMRERSGSGRNEGRPQIGTPNLITLLSESTGMPALLLAPDRALDPDAIRTAFASQIMGQEGAIDVVRDLIVRIKAGLCDPGRPYGVFLFTGPTGTGKTEMAKALAEYLFGDEARLVRLDMSEYNVPGSAARLIGDRFQPQGVLTSAVRAQPFCVVLLDEVEKADPSVLNLMLQLFDDGRLSDAAGEVADFRHALIIMTSNLGAGGGSSMGFAEGRGDARERGHNRALLQDIARAVREFFPPELFNRIDRVVEFHPLDQRAAEAIARRELSRLLTRRGLIERNIFVRYTEAVLAKVVAEGFNPRDGARSLKRWLEDNIGSLLVDTLTRSRAASMRLLWLHVGGGSAASPVSIHLESMREAEPIPEQSRLVELLEQPNNALLAQVPAALEFLRSLDGSPRLAQLSQTLAELLTAYNRTRGSETDLDSNPEYEASQANALYNLEVLRGKISELRQALELHASYDDRLDRHVESREAHFEGLGEQLEVDRFPRDSPPPSDGSYRSRQQKRFDRRQFTPDLPLRERQTMLRAIAEVWFLERAITSADDPTQHAVFLELSRVGDPRRRGRFDAFEGGIFAALVHAYAGEGRGDLEAWAVLRRGDTKADIEAHGPEEDLESPSAALQRAASDPRTEVLVLQLVGPSVREFFAGESGSHILESLGGGHEIVRVRALTVADLDTPQALLERVQGQRDAFVTALESGLTPLPLNPDAMLPITRRFKLEEARAGRPQTVEVEDYPLSHVSAHNSASLQAIMPLLWLMRVGVAIRSEEGVEGASP